MRYLILLLLAGFAFGQVQVRHLDTKDLFKGTAYADSVKKIDSLFVKLSGKELSHYQLHDSATTAETIYTRWLTNMDAMGSLVVAGRLEKISGTVNTSLHIGLYRGAGWDVPNGGVQWKHIWTTTTAASDSFKVILTDSTWWQEEITSDYIYRIKQTGNQGVRFILDEFKWEDDQ